MTAAMLAVPFAGSAAAAQVTPTLVPGNPQCDDVLELNVDYEFSRTSNNPPQGSSTIVLSPTSSIVITRAGDSFNFAFTPTGEFEAAGVIVKGGPNANFYDYTGIGGVKSDTDLTTPTNPNNNRPYGISHIEFCIDEAPQAGALAIRKTSTKGDNPLVGTAGTTFETQGPSGTVMVTDNGGNDSNPTVGEVCVTGLEPGDYTVTETSPPPGYGAGTAVGDNVGTVVSGTDCSGNPPSTANTVEFRNPPLADLEITVTGQNDETINSAVCTDSENNTVLDTGSGNQVGGGVTLPPGTYDCTVVIDP